MREAARHNMKNVRLMYFLMMALRVEYASNSKDSPLVTGHFQPTIPFKGGRQKTDVSSWKSGEAQKVRTNIAQSYARGRAYECKTEIV